MVVATGGPCSVAAIRAIPCCLLARSPGPFSPSPSLSISLSLSLPLPLPLSPSPSISPSAHCSSHLPPPRPTHTLMWSRPRLSISSRYCYLSPWWNTSLPDAMLANLDARLGDMRGAGITALFNFGTLLPLRPTDIAPTAIAHTR